VKELILQLEKRRLTWNVSVKELGIPGVVIDGNDGTGDGDVCSQAASDAS
jgi:hypothetical protein